MTSRFGKVTRKLFGVLFGVGAVIYLGLLLARAGGELTTENQVVDTTMHNTIAVFGATGTIGDGLLKAAMNDPDVNRIYVVTRRPSPRIEEGMASGEIEMIIHKDYLDYSAIQDVLVNVDAVFWAIGISSAGVDEETYGEIHVDIPSQFVAEWLSVSKKDEISLHYVSGSGANADSRMMWAREKARAETELEQLAVGSKLQVVSYRPAVILPTEAEAHLGHRIAYTILAPIKSAVAAESIGRAMLEVSARGQQYQNGTILENREIIGLNDAYQERVR